MTSALNPDSGGAAPDPYHGLREEFREISDRLHEMVDEYDDEPSSIVGGILAEDDDEANVISAVKQAYRLMKARINAPDSPLRADIGVWDAFAGQLEELSAVHGKAIDELENFQEDLQSYGIVKGELRSRGEPGKLAENERVFRDERRRCIDAVTDFYKKFSGMLTGL